MPFFVPAECLTSLITSVLSVLAQPHLGKEQAECGSPTCSVVIMTRHWISAGIAFLGPQTHVYTAAMLLSSAKVYRDID